jgi:hypothetical protein
MASTTDWVSLRMSVSSRNMGALPLASKAPRLSREESDLLSKDRRCPMSKRGHCRADRASDPGHRVCRAGQA